ncbi:glycosyltransferase [Bacteroides reticulotermitis]|uniref:glycosyltransferase n=1 Tax=Bacteroides reticulotermitis TaxID=1133319 RepID=UPI00190F387D|nr:glycosyltransferase [Bacteroides reticulotermitis]
MEISVVSPVYKAENFVMELVRQIIDNVERLSSDFEIILVNDASPDKSWQEISKICKNDKRVKGINLSRNFGQHYAITAGLNFAQGEWVVVMDCDLQDRPDEIPNLYRQALEVGILYLLKGQSGRILFLNECHQNAFMRYLVI